MPRPRLSSSFQAAPIPSQARPPDSTSRVVTVLTSTPGCRYTTAVTMAPSSRREVTPAR